MIPRFFFFFYFNSKLPSIQRFSFLFFSLSLLPTSDWSKHGGILKRSSRGRVVRRWFNWDVKRGISRMLEDQPFRIQQCDRDIVDRVPLQKNINSIYGEQGQNSILIESEGEEPLNESILINHPSISLFHCRWSIISYYINKSSRFKKLVLSRGSVTDCDSFEKPFFQFSPLREEMINVHR